MMAGLRELRKSRTMPKHCSPSPSTSQLCPTHFRRIATMSATRKVEIHEHTQQNWMDRTIEQLAPYRRAILGLVLALLVGVFAIALLSRQSKQKQERAWDNYFTVDQITSANEEAARKAITELGNTESALMLKMKLGHF